MVSDSCYCLISRVKLIQPLLCDGAIWFCVIYTHHSQTKDKCSPLDNGKIVNNIFIIFPILLPYWNKDLKFFVIILDCFLNKQRVFIHIHLMCSLTFLMENHWMVKLWLLSQIDHFKPKVTLGVERLHWMPDTQWTGQALL